MGGNEKADGKVKGPWEAKLDTHTFIRRVTKESKIMLPVQVDTGAHKPTSVFWEKLKPLGFECILSEGKERIVFDTMYPSLIKCFKSCVSAEVVLLSAKRGQSHASAQGGEKNQKPI